MKQVLFAKVRADDADTVDVTFNGKTFLVFSGNSKVIEEEKECWSCFHRSPEGHSKTAREFLVQGWQALTAELFEETPDLVWDCEVN